MEDIVFYGADWCPDCRRAKAYLKSNNIDYKFVDVDINEAATDLVQTLNNGKRIIPTIVINGTVYSNPPNDIIAASLGLNEDKGRVILYGADWCPDCRRAKSYLQDNSINFQFIEVDKHDWAAQKVEQINNGKRIIPTIFINDKSYTNPNNAILQQELNIEAVKSTQCYDTLIVGAGAAGLTTAIYVQRDRFNSVIIEKKNVGGNAYLTEKIENYPGFTKISGPKLMDRMADQAVTYGAQIKTGIELQSVEKQSNGVFQVQTNMGEYKARTLVLALGSTYRQLGIPGESELIGAGIHFCATCDGAFYRDREIIVIGGGNSALEEGIFLANFCKKVTIVNRSAAFKASPTYVEKLSEIENIEVHHNKKSKRFLSDDKGLFKALVVEDSSGEEMEISADGVFIFIGLIPNTQAVSDLVALDERGFIETTGMGETSVSGIFAAGDCRKGAIAQVAAATGEGILASYGVKAYLQR